MNSAAPLTCHCIVGSLHAVVPCLVWQGVPTVDRRSLVEVRQHVEWWDENSRVNVRQQYRTPYIGLAGNSRKCFPPGQRQQSREYSRILRSTPGEVQKGAKILLVLPAPLWHTHTRFPTTSLWLSPRCRACPVSMSSLIRRIMTQRSWCCPTCCLCSPQSWKPCVVDLVRTNTVGTTITTAAPLILLTTSPGRCLC